MQRRNALFNESDLQDNPNPRVPVCLCLDVSASMNAVEGTYTRTGEKVFSDGRWWEKVHGGTTRIEELQKGIEAFYRAIYADDLAVTAAEICIVLFSDNAVCVTDFAGIERQTIPRLTASGNTHMGEGVNLALDLLEKRKEQYRRNGVDYYQPWLVLMTDGVPNGSALAMKQAADRIAELVGKRKLSVFPIAIGNEADISALQRLSPVRKPMKLKDLRFTQFFEWLGKSVASVSHSRLGEPVQADVEGMKDWTDLD